VNIRGMITLTFGKDGQYWKVQKIKRFVEGVRRGLGKDK